MTGTMISIGGLALLLIGGSEIKPAPVIPYMTMFNGCLVVPPMWILYSRFARYKHVNSILQNNLTKQEYQAILENSDQTFICHDDSHEAKYFNSKGHNMLKGIAEMTEDKEENLEDLDSKKSVFDVHGQVQNFFSNKSLFMASFFKLYSNADGNGEDLNKLFSFDDFKSMPSDELQNKVFVHNSSDDNMKLDDNLILNTVFFQIKMQKIKLNMQNYFIYVINEVSNVVKIQRLMGEKKLLEMINALVSHEMRNPLNSINTMIIKNIDLCNQILDFIFDRTLSVQRLRLCLKNHVDQLVENLQIQQSSSKVMDFCVNDMISFAQINSNNFRKNSRNIDIKKSIEEIIMIQRHKAEFNKISLTCEFSGFESYLVCTDEIRLQQVLLNFQSNALKFTKFGGKVTIKCAYIPTSMSGRHGMIEVSVLDSGVGIRVED